MSPVSARTEDDVEVFLPDTVEANGLVELSLRSSIFFEPERKFRAENGFVAFGI
jgi:hypothetical protein